jgi:hypothetical protein
MGSELDDKIKKVFNFIRLFKIEISLENRKEWNDKIW